MKAIKSILILSLFMLTASCSVESMQKGSLTLKMTDDPADYAEVNVEILDVEVHYADSDTNSSSQGWISLDAKAGVYDLLELQDSVTAVLADSVELISLTLYLEAMLLSKLLNTLNFEISTKYSELTPNSTCKLSNIVVALMFFSSNFSIRATMEFSV